MIVISLVEGLMKVIIDAGEERVAKEYIKQRVRELRQSRISPFESVKFDYNSDDSQDLDDLLGMAVVSDLLKSYSSEGNEKFVITDYGRALISSLENRFGSISIKS